jgi:hypothetical protein
MDSDLGSWLATDAGAARFRSCDHPGRHVRSEPAFARLLSRYPVYVTVGQYLTSAPFLVKMASIALAVFILVYARKTLARDAAAWEAAGAAPPIAKKLGLSSMAFWILAVISGRLIAYIGYS